MGWYDLRLPHDFFEIFTFAEFCGIADRHSVAQKREQFFFFQVCEHIRWALGCKETREANLNPYDAAATAPAPVAATVADRAAMEQRFLNSIASLIVESP